MVGVVVGEQCGFDSLVLRLQLSKPMQQGFLLCGILRRRVDDKKFRASECVDIGVRGRWEGIGSQGQDCEIEGKLAGQHLRIVERRPCNGKGM